MELRFLMEGTAFTLYAILQGEDIVDYLGKLEQDNTRAHAQIMRRIVQLSERGPSSKKDEFNSLGNGLFEVKAKSGPRVIFFYDQNRIVICFHAFDKHSQKTPKREIDKAVHRKNQYERHKKSGQGFKIHLKKEEKEPKRQP
jgi:phage-related protein